MAKVKISIATGDEPVKLVMDEPGNPEHTRDIQSNSGYDVEVSVGTRFGITNLDLADMSVDSLRQRPVDPATESTNTAEKVENEANGGEGRAPGSVETILTPGRSDKQKKDIAKREGLADTDGDGKGETSTTKLYKGSGS